MAWLFYNFSLSDSLDKTIKMVHKDSKSLFSLSNIWYSIVVFIKQIYLPDACRPSIIFFLAGEGPKHSETLSNYSISVLAFFFTLVKSQHQSLLTSASLFADIVRMPALQCFRLASEWMFAHAHEWLGMMMCVSRRIRFVKAYAQPMVTICRLEVDPTTTTTSPTIRVFVQT